MKTRKPGTGKVKNPKGAKDIYAMRKRKKRKRVLQQSIFLLLLSMTILILYQRRDSWIPKLETIGTRHQSRRQGDGTEQDGNFPISIFGETEYQTGKAGESLLVLNDSYLFVYDTDGSLESARQHAYGGAMLRDAGDYALVYEYGGTSFRLDTEAKMRYEKKVNDPIIFGRVSGDGTVALVTNAESCACKLLVFNVKGQQFYERDCVERIADISFCPDGSGCIAISTETDEGALKSVVHSYSFSQKEDVWTSQPLDMLAISVYNTNDGNVFVLGDTACCYFSADGVLTGSYVYPDTLQRAAFSDGIAALVLSNHEKRTETVVILNGSADARTQRTYEKTVMDLGIEPEKQTVTVLFRNQIEVLDPACTVLGTAPVTDSCDGFLRIGGYLFLKGYNHISRMDDPGF